MSYLGTKDFGLEVAKGNVAGHSKINKFGAAPDGGQTTYTDIWDRADATPTQQVWTAPTQARVHAIVSTSTDDDAGTGQGAWTIRVYGLASWSASETSEDVTMDGQVGVNTSGSYVIIHRMKVLTSGTNGPNVGNITATAASDATVTAQISIGRGQTLMAIYGWPSTQTLYVTAYYASLHKAQGAASSCEFDLWVNPEPGTNAATWLVKQHRGLQSTGANESTFPFDPPASFAGPGIIKLTALSSVADMDVSGGFNAYVVDN